MKYPSLRAVPGNRNANFVSDFAAARLGRLASPWMAAALFTLVYITLTLSAWNWDPMHFVNIGGRYDPRVNNDSWGYDGQFAYQIARDPLNAREYLDVPAYRYQRIVYPILARALSFGSTGLLPWMLIIVNAAGLVAGTKVTEILLQEHGQSRWYALTYGLFVGLQISVRLDLTEVLAFLWVLLAILFFERKALWKASLFFMIATLTRELTLTFVAAAALALFFQKRRVFSFTWAGITVLPFIAWQVVLKLWLGEWAIRSGGAFATPFELLPFRGLWSIAGNVPPVMFIAFVLVIAPIAFIPAMVSVYASARDLIHGKTNFATWSLLLNALLIPFLPQSNITAVSGMVRVVAGLVVAVLHFGMRNRSKRALNYSLLWLICLVFLYKDSFVGTVN